MKQVRTFLSILAIATSSAFVGCDYNLFSGCGEGDWYEFTTQNALRFLILDKATRENVLYIGQTNYNYDTVKVYDISGNVTVPYQNGEWTAWDGRMDLIFLDYFTDRNVVNQRITRRYYMYFDYMDIDTIDLAFEMRIDKCDRQIMKYFKVAYNDSVYYDGYTDRVWGVEFLKER